MFGYLRQETILNIAQFREITLGTLQNKISVRDPLDCVRRVGLSGPRHSTDRATPWIYVVSLSAPGISHKARLKTRRLSRAQGQPRGHGRLACTRAVARV